MSFRTSGEAVVQAPATYRTNIYWILLVKLTTNHGLQHQEHRVQDHYQLLLDRWS